MVQQWYILDIWSRDDYKNDGDETLKLVASSKRSLQRRYYNYLESHRDDEDYMDNDDFEYYLTNVNEVMDGGGPELNCAYITKQYIIYNYDDEDAHCNILLHLEPDEFDAGVHISLNLISIQRVQNNDYKVVIKESQLNKLQDYKWIRL